MNLQAITKSIHKNKFWQRFKSYSFTANSHYAPVVLQELPQTLRTFPIALIRQQDRYVLVALLSLTPNQNLFVDRSGRWLGAYVPAWFRSYPFRLARPKEENRPILCVDEDSGLLSDTDGEPFFDQEGNLSKPVQEAFEFLNQVEKNRVATQKAVDSLAESEVVTEWKLKVKSEGEEKQVAGLYKIDEAQLNRLDDQIYLDLRKTNALPIAYAQLFSMGNISVLDRLAKYHAQQQQKEPVEQDVDIEQLFGDDATLNFDNI